MPLTDQEHEIEILRQQNARLAGELRRQGRVIVWLAEECEMLIEAARKIDPVLGNLVEGKV